MRSSIGLKYYLKKDSEIVIAAIAQNNFAIEFAHQQLKTNRSVLLAAFKEDKITTDANKNNYPQYFF